MKVRCRLCRSRVEKSDTVNGACSGCRDQWYGGGRPGGKSAQGSQKCKVCRNPPLRDCRNPGCPR